MAEHPRKGLKYTRISIHKGAAKIDKIAMQCSNNEQCQKVHRLTVTNIHKSAAKISKVASLVFFPKTNELLFCYDRGKEGQEGERKRKKERKKERKTELERRKEKKTKEKGNNKEGMKERNIEM